MSEPTTSALDVLDDSRILGFRKIFVKDPPLMEILTAISCLHRTGKGVTHSQCMGLFGPSGSGKTRLVQYYKHGYLKTQPISTYELDGIEVTTFPILIVECPAHATIKGLAETLLTALGDPKPWRGSQQEMTQRVLYGLRLRRVSLIVLDEFQHLSNQVRSNYAAYETADWLKSLLNANICPILLVGTEAAASVLRVNEQLQRRSFAVHRFQPYSITNRTDFQIFKAMLEGLEKAMNLPLPSGLADENLASRIHAATEGLIGRITGLLDRALLLAIERKENCITRQTLHDVYSRIFNVTDSGLNPFSAGDQPEPSSHQGDISTRAIRARGNNNHAALRIKDLLG